MKKIIAFILATIMVLAVFPIQAFAVTIPNKDSVEKITDYKLPGSIDTSKYTDHRLDLSKYTLNDIEKMSFDEFSDLVTKFMRVYCPEDYETVCASIGVSTTEHAPAGTKWTSGDYETDTTEWTSVGTHEYISMIACNNLYSYVGFFSNNATLAVVIILLIAVGSLLPDYYEALQGGLFAGHFYDPDTEQNYLWSTTNTAKTNAVAHYNSAVQYASNNDMENAYKHIGMCLHYVQDACEPHHASNVTGVNPSHGQFEKYAERNMEAILNNYNLIGSTTYISKSIADLVKDGAKAGKSWISKVKKALPIMYTTYYVNGVYYISGYEQWYTAADATLKNAAFFSECVLAHFGTLENNVPFYFN